MPARHGPVLGRMNVMGSKPISSWVTVSYFSTGSPSKFSITPAHPPGFFSIVNHSAFVDGPRRNYLTSRIHGSTLQGEGSVDMHESFSKSQWKFDSPETPPSCDTYSGMDLTPRDGKAIDPQHSWPSLKSLLGECRQPWIYDAATRPRESNGAHTGYVYLLAYTARYFLLPYFIYLT